MGLSFENVLGTHIGTSKSGIKVKKHVMSDGATRMTSFKRGNVLKEVTQMPQRCIGGVDTFVHDFIAGESTTITKFIDRTTGKTTALFSYSKPMDGPFAEHRILRFMQQIFKDGKLVEVATNLKK